MMHLKSFSTLLIIPLTALIVNANTINPPVITVEPKDSTVQEGQPVSFSVVATGDSLTYRWKKNDTTSLSNATSATYSINQASGRDSGATYKCIVSNSAGGDTSRAAILNVKLNPPTISTQPITDTVYEGESGRFTVRANGSRLSYQWQKNSVNCTDTNAVKSTYTTPLASLSDNGAAYRCVVSNSGGRDTSDSAILYVMKSPPVIGAQPQNDTVSVGETAIFKVSATSKYPPMSFQWRKRSATDTVYTDISGATDSIYTTPAAVETDHAARFLCVVSDSGGNVSSNSARLYILFATPVIVADPVGDTLFVGDTAVFQISVQGKGLQFQWQKNMANITGVNDSIYRLKTVLADSGKLFRCIVRNTGGSDTSDSALLIVKSITPIINNITIKFNKFNTVFNVGPNPTTTGAYFKYLGKDKKDGILEIFDAVGNLIYKDDHVLIPNAPYFLRWDLRNTRGKKIGEGAYLAILKTVNSVGKIEVYGQLIGIRKEK